MKKAFGRLQLRAGGKASKANRNDDTVQAEAASRPAALPSSKVPEYVRLDEIDSAATMSTCTTTHSSEESHAETDYDPRQEDRYIRFITSFAQQNYNALHSYPSFLSNDGEGGFLTVLKMSSTSHRGGSTVAYGSIQVFGSRHMSGSTYLWSK